MNLDFNRAETPEETAAREAAAREAAAAAQTGPPSGRGTVTKWLIGINALVFVAMVVKGVSFIDPTTLDGYNWGADFGPATVLEHQWWRMFTSCFVHFGIVHIAVNMYVLYQVGPLTERLFGHTRFLLMYLMAGLWSSALSLLIHPMIVSAGASGAIFGVYGALLAFIMVCRGVLQPAAAKTITQSAGIFIIYNVIFGLRPGTHTDVGAHIGGLIGGFVVGAGLAWSLRSPRQRTARTAAVMVASCVVLVVVAHLLPGIVQPQLDAMQ